jgi:hypothetical protein
VLACATNVHSPAASAFFRLRVRPPSLLVRLRVRPPSLLVRLQASPPFYLSASPFKTAAILTVVKEHFADPFKPSAFGFYLGFSGSAHLKDIFWSALPMVWIFFPFCFSKIATYRKSILISIW